MRSDDGAGGDDGVPTHEAATGDGGPPLMETEGDLVATYTERAGERRLTFERGDASADEQTGGAAAGRTVVAQPRSGYGMLTVRDGQGRELERYYGFAMALDHAAERLGVRPAALPVPEAANDMGL